MGTKTEWLQIRVAPLEKAALRRRARAAGLDLSSFVLARALPPAPARFAGLLDTLRGPAERGFVLAELHDFLVACPPSGFAEAVAEAALDGLSAFERNYVAAMVEHAAAQKGVAPPAWVRAVEPLEDPWFATPLAGLRMHLLRSAPVPFKRRHLFVDAGVGDRV